MIKVDMNGAKLEGSSVELCVEFSMLVRTFREMMAEHYNDKIADLLVTECGKIAYKTDEELNDKHARREWQKDMFDKIFKEN